MRECKVWGSLAFGVLAAVCSVGRAQVTLGHLDDFQDLSTHGWAQGPLSPNQPTVVSSGGPGGAGDAYLQNISTGLSGTASRMVVLTFGGNWTGNYPAAGVTRVDVQMADFSGTALSMRLGFADANDTRYISTTAVTLPADGKWHSLSFGITPADLTLVKGADSVGNALASVTAFRFMSSTFQTFEGDAVAATLGMDNVHAVPEPGAVGILVGASGIFLGRRRKS